MPPMVLRAVLKGDPDELLRGYEAATESNARNHPKRPLSHVCAKLPDGFMVVDVWESEEELRRFTEGTLRESLSRTNLPEPEVFETYPVHRFGWPEAG